MTSWIVFFNKVGGIVLLFFITMLYVSVVSLPLSAEANDYAQNTIVCPCAESTEKSSENQVGYVGEPLDDYRVQCINNCLGLVNSHSRRDVHQCTNRFRALNYLRSVGYPLPDLKIMIEIAKDVLYFWEVGIRQEEQYSIEFDMAARAYALALACSLGDERKRLINRFNEYRDILFEYYEKDEFLQMLEIYLDEFYPGTFLDMAELYADLGDDQTAINLWEKSEVNTDAWSAKSKIKYYISLFNSTDDVKEASEFHSSIFKIVREQELMEQLELSGILYKKGFHSEVKSLWQEIYSNHCREDVANSLYQMTNPQNGFFVMEQADDNLRIDIYERVIACGEAQVGEFNIMYAMQNVSYLYIATGDLDAAFRSWERDRQYNGGNVDASQASYYFALMRADSKYATDENVQKIMESLSRYVLSNDLMYRALDDAITAGEIASGLDSFFDDILNCPYLPNRKYVEHEIMLMRIIVNPTKLTMTLDLNDERVESIYRMQVQRLEKELDRLRKEPEEELQDARRWDADNAINNSTPFHHYANYLIRLYFIGGEEHKAQMLMNELISDQELDMGLASFAIHKALETYSELQRWQDLAYFCERYLSKHPDEKEIKLTLAIAYENLGRCREAITIYEPLSGAFYRKKTGECLLSEGDEQAAVHAWRPIMESAEEQGETPQHGALAFIDLLIDNMLLAPALHATDKALEAWPNDPAFHKRKIQILLAQEQSSEALKALLAMQRILPDSTHLKFIKQHTLAMYRDNSCEHILGEIRPDIEGGWWDYEWSSCSLVKGNAGQAVFFANKALSHDSDNTLFKTALAVALSEHGDLSAAARTFDELAALSDSDRLFYLLEAGHSLHLMGQEDSSMGAWKFAEDLAAVNPLSLFIFGRMCFNHGRYEDAVKKLSLLAKITTDNTHAMATLAAAYVALNREQEFTNMKSNYPDAWNCDMLERTATLLEQTQRNIVFEAAKTSGCSDIDDMAPRVESEDDIRFIRLVNALSRHEKFFEYARIAINE